MPYSLQKPFSDFIAEVKELDRIIIRLAKEPNSIERDIFVEGCFLRLVVNWENFVEEYFLRCMCGGNKRGKGSIKPKGSCSRNIAEAYSRLHYQGAAREKHYLDWLSTHTVQKRIDDYFRKNSRVQYVLLDPGILDDAKVVRNAIAHRSVFSMEKVKRIILARLGIVLGSQTIAQMVLSKDIRTGLNLYEKTSGHFSYLADQLTR